MPWRIYYADGSTFDDANGLPEAAPLDGIQIIVECLSNGQLQYHQDRDFYLWTGDSWHHGYQREFDTWVRNLAPKIKYGLCIAKGDYDAIVKEAMQWRSQ